MASRSDPRTTRRALITGLAGFTGGYVASELRDAGYEVVGLPPALDLCDRNALQGFVGEQRFDAVVHLAAISFVAHGDAEAIYRVNIVGTRNLLESLDRAEGKPRIVVLASSANIYGNATEEPITEATVPAPANDYAVSKLAMEHMARLWADRLPIVIARPFNYTGVGQGKQFLIPKIVDHYRRRQTEIELGNTDVIRDFLDVRDVAYLYRLLVEHAPIGRVFNLCSGRGHSLGQVIDMAGELAGYRVAVKVNPQFVRGNEVKRLVGSPAAIAQLAPGFVPRPLTDTLAWMLGEVSD